MKSITWELNVVVLRGNYKYNMILGREILSKLKIDLCFYENTIRVNVGA